MAAVVDADAAALPDLQPGLPGQGVGGSNTGGEQQHVGLNVGTVLETQAMTGLLPCSMHSVAFSTSTSTPRAWILSRSTAPPLVELHRHQPGGELHHLGLEPEQAQGVGRLQPQQAATDDHAAAGLGAGIADGGEISQGAIDEAALPLMTGDGGTKGTEPVASTRRS